jgi:acyl-CoA thioester hydrolase
MEKETHTHHFPVKLHLRLDWSEMDLFGHINNVMYFKYIQASRINFWEHVGFMNRYYKEKIGPILVSTGCQFSKPLFYPDNITIEVRVEFIKTTSIGLHHRILNGENELSAEAHDVIVLYDFAKNEKVTIPAELRAAMENPVKK